MVANNQIKHIKRLSMSKEQTPITAREHKSRMHFLDLATEKLSHGVHKTFKETCSYGFSEISKVVYYAMNMYDRQTLNKADEEKEQYAQYREKKAVQEALEREVKELEKRREHVAKHPHIKHFVRTAKLKELDNVINQLRNTSETKV